MTGRTGPPTAFGITAPFAFNAWRALRVQFKLLYRDHFTTLKALSIFIHVKFLSAIPEKFFILFIQ